MSSNNIETLHDQEIVLPLPSFTEKEIGIFVENFKEFYILIINLFTEWKSLIHKRIMEIKKIENERDLELNLSIMTSDLVKKNQEFLDKTKESFFDNAKSVQLAFDSLTSHVEVEKKTIEIKDLKKEIEELKNELLLNHTKNILQSCGFQDTEPLKQRLTEQEKGYNDLQTKFMNNEENSFNEFQNLQQNFLGKKKSYDELYIKFGKLQDINNEFKKDRDKLNLENYNLKLRTVKNELKNDDLLKKLKESEIFEKKMKNENEEKSDMLMNLGSNLEILLNENEKLTVILNEKLQLIERRNIEIEQLKRDLISNRNEIQFLQNKFKDKNYNSIEFMEIEIKKIEERSKFLLENNENLSNEILLLIESLEIKNGLLSKYSEIYSQLFQSKQDLEEKLNIIINLNDHLNDIILINSEEIFNLKEVKNKSEQREVIISDLLEENNELRTYFNKNFIDLEEKNLLKFIIQQNEHEIMILKEENQELLKLKDNEKLEKLQSDNH